MTDKHDLQSEQLVVDALPVESGNQRVETLETGHDAATYRVVEEGREEQNIRAMLTAATMTTILWYLFISV